MKLNTTRETLQHIIGPAAAASEKRATLPILSMVLLEYDGSRLQATGNDLETQVQAHSDLLGGDPGAVCVPAQKLTSILKLAPPGAQVELKSDGDKIRAKVGPSRYSLATLPVDNYPAFDSGATELEATVPSETLRLALDKTQFAMAQQDVRYYLNGLLLDLDGNTLRTVASDGHRLALFQEALPTPFASNRQVIIPRKGIQELSRLLGDADDTVIIQISPNSVRVDLGDVSFSSKLIEGRYPHYQRVIPTELNRRYRADKELLRGALGRVSLLSGEKQKSIRLDVEGGVMVLNGKNAEHEEAEERLDVEAESGDVSAGFNAGYLQEAITHADSEHVWLSFTPTANSCLIEDTADQRYKFVVMPMRL